MSRRQHIGCVNCSTVSLLGFLFLKWRLDDVTQSCFVVLQSEDLKFGQCQLCVEDHKKTTFELKGEAKSKVKNNGKMKPAVLKVYSSSSSTKVQNEAARTEIKL